jgi:hypothetical protein
MEWLIFDRCNIYTIKSTQIIFEALKFKPETLVGIYRYAFHIKIIAEK